VNDRFKRDELVDKEKGSNEKNHRHPTRKVQSNEKEEKIRQKKIGKEGKRTVIKEKEWKKLNRGEMSESLGEKRKKAMEGGISRIKIIKKIG